MKKHFFLAALAVVLFSACVPQPLLTEYKSIALRKWSYADVQKFQVHISDNSKPYQVFVNLRHTPDYNFSNIFVLVHEKGPQLPDSTTRHELKLAELDGKWTGISAGNLYEKDLLIKDSYIFPDTGIYTFEIEQNMRENPLLHISDVGLKVKVQDHR